MNTMFLEGHTPLGGVMYDGILPSELCLSCEYPDEWGCSYPVDCTCPADPMHTFSACNVYLLGNPVRTKPTESTYRIQIWKTVVPKSRCSIDLLYEVQPAVTFPLAAVQDAVDMEHMYVPIVKEHMSLLKSIDPYMGKFNAPADRASYVSDLKQRLDQMLLSKERPDGSENPHVAPRKRAGKK
jgi:hypothetical protein